MSKPSIFFITPLILVLIGNVTANTSPEQETLSRQNFLKQLVTIKGRVVNRSGQPLAASVQIAGLSTNTDVNGYFSVPNIKRKGHLLIVSASGYNKEIISITTSERPYRSTIKLNAIILDQRKTDTLRMIFGGDTSFGRRFLDPMDITPPGQIPADNPNALILASDPLPGSKQVFKYIRPFYQAADWASVNLETPITNNPATPHETKDYTFFSLPESLPALTWLGVDYVGLGNNHVFDYLELGLQDTLAAIQQAGLPFSGAGPNNLSAIKPYRTRLKNTPYSFFAMTSIAGREHPIDYLAGPNKGGAADLTDSELVAKSINAEVTSGRVPIVQLHSGIEYSKFPGIFTKNAFELATKSGAALVVGHHPHVVQGIAITDGIVNIHSLGNFAFDQDRLETMLGISARVDMRGKQLDSVRILPHYLEDYRPRPIVNNLADFLIKRMAEQSRPYNGFIYPYNNQGWVSLNNNDFIKIDRSIDIKVTVPASGSMILDLRKYQFSRESLAKFTVAAIDTSAHFTMGRDLMEHHGDMEDYDIDDQYFEAERWDTNGISNYICVGQGYSGVSGLCSTRNAANSDDSVIPFRNRIRIQPDNNGVANKNVTLYGVAKSINAGKVTVVTRYFASEGDEVFGEEVAYEAVAGNYDWKEINAPLHIPDDIYPTDELNPRAFRFFLRLSPPAKGDAKVIYDNIAAIAWENAIVSGSQLATPHPQEFIKIVAKPGVYDANLVFSRYKPNLATNASTPK